MADMVDGFARDFQRIEGGYVYYPSAKSGGKFLSQSEYLAAFAGWRRATSRIGLWGGGGVTLALMAILGVSTAHHGIPRPVGAAVMLAVPGLFLSWLIWKPVAFRSALARLVRERPDAVPARPAGELYRERRKALNWPFVIIMSLFSDAKCLDVARSGVHSPGQAIWVGALGSICVGYLGLALFKLRDMRPRTHAPEGDRP